jgi:hypothetical protein
MPTGHGGQRKSAGRPKGSLASHTLEAQTLRQYMIEQVKANKKELVEALIKKGISGDVSALKEIMDRSLGKVKDSMEISTPKEDPLAQILADIRKNNKDIVTERLEREALNR